LIAAIVGEGEKMVPIVRLTRAALISMLRIGAPLCLSVGLSTTASAAPRFDDHPVGNGGSRLEVGIEIAQFLGDALTCAFTAFADICIANNIERILDTLPRGQGDAARAFWYQTILSARDDLFFVPQPSSVVTAIANEDYATAIIAARMAFERDPLGALDLARQIASPQPAIRALLGVASGQIKRGFQEGAVATLGEAAELLNTMTSPQERFVLAEEIAWGQVRAGDLSAAAATIDGVLAANDGLPFPPFVKAINAIAFAGSSCASRGSGIGMALLEDGIRALETAPVVPPAIRATAMAWLARGYGRCGDPLMAEDWAAEAAALAASLSPRERLVVLVSLVGTVP
jgi:hypothetical protein